MGIKSGHFSYTKDIQITLYSCSRYFKELNDLKDLLKSDNLKVFKNFITLTHLNLMQEKTLKTSDLKYGEKLIKRAKLHPQKTLDTLKFQRL